MIFRNKNVYLPRNVLIRNYLPPSFSIKINFSNCHCKSIEVSEYLRNDNTKHVNPFYNPHFFSLIQLLVRYIYYVVNICLMYMQSWSCALSSFNYVNVSCTIFFVLFQDLVNNVTLNYMLSSWSSPLLFSSSRIIFLFLFKRTALEAGVALGCFSRATL